MTTKQLPDLSHFWGSEKFFRYPLCQVPFVFTEGWEYLADKAGAVWLISVVSSYQTKKLIEEHPFQLWKIKLNKAGGCTVSAHDDSGEPAFISQEIEYTDFPEDFEWYVVNNGGGACMMLKSEY